jgi:hypothetical protein
VVPDLFTPIRPLLCHPDGSPRLCLLRSCQMLWLICTIAFIAGGIRRYNREKDPYTELQTIRMMQQGFLFGSSIFYMWPLYRAIQPETGHLAELGVGSTRRITASQLRSLKIWRLLLTVPAVGITFFGFFICSYGVNKWLEFAGLKACVIEDGGEMDEDCVNGTADVLNLTAPLAPIMMFFGWGSMIAWYLSLRMAVMLSRDDVMIVVERTNIDALVDDETWCAAVARPTIRLATHTMRTLSAGWGAGTGYSGVQD